MIFMVLVGGLGTFEGPILGAIILFLIQNHWGSSGVWYFVGPRDGGDPVRAVPAARAVGDAARPLLDPAAARTGRFR